MTSIPLIEHAGPQLRHQGARSSPMGVGMYRDCAERSNDFSYVLLVFWFLRLLPNRSNALSSAAPIMIPTHGKSPFTERFLLVTGLLRGPRVGA